ncbi:MAG: gamma-glutamyl-gamma-aminobutyrate hydrolase family protein [Flavisolibacter sp.]
MRIGLTYTGSDKKHENYVRWLKGPDSFEIIKLNAEDHNQEEIKKCNGLVLSGGIDIHPKFYKKEKLDYDHAPLVFDEQRDLFEIALFNEAINLEIPILGICRGMQLVNICLGGTLKQDLGVLNTSHRSEGNDKVHGVRVQKNTVLNDELKGENLLANSAHHQAIDQLGKGLKINAFSEDGLAEGLEWDNPLSKPALLCVQWHPERMYAVELGDAPLSRSIRSIFIGKLKK